MSSSKERTKKYREKLKEDEEKYNEEKTTYYKACNVDQC